MPRARNGFLDTHHQRMLSAPGRSPSLVDVNVGAESFINYYLVLTLLYCGANYEVHLPDANVRQPERPDRDI